MTSYKVRYYREPACSNASQDQELTFDLVDVAYAAISETLQTGGPSSAFANQLSAFLTENQYLTWKGNGPGIGRELRRSYSNIHGRFFARAYLEKCEGVGKLLPIEGNRFRLPDQTEVRLRDGQMGDMPDWIGEDSNRGMVVAEAKGTFEQKNWSKAFYGGNSLPRCLQNAQKQVNRVQINQDKQYRNAFDLEFKGWSVASRWATEKNGVEPWLAAIDPRLGAQPLTDEEARRNFSLALQHTTFSRIVYGLGYSDENPIGKIVSFEAVRPTVFNGRRDAWREVEILEASSTMRGLSAVHFNGAFFPVQSNRVLDSFRDRSVKGRQVWLVTALAEALDATERREVLEVRETSWPLTHLSRNGLAITKIENARFVN